MSSSNEAPESPPLAGVVILDLSRALAAPFATMMLADLGATVLKVEDPRGGDQSREWGVEIGESTRTYFFAANRSKKSIAINVAHEEGAALVRQLAAKSDVLMENFMRRSLPKYGLGADRLLPANPRLIYCSLSGYGRTGPMADRPGYDGVIQAESGIMAVTGEPHGRPTKVGVPISDTVAGMYAAHAVLAALYARERTGRGQLIDVSMLDCSIAAMASVATNAVLLGLPPKRYGNDHADVVPQSTYPASDGSVMIHIGTNEQFQRFCHRVLDAPVVAEDPRFLTNTLRAHNRAAIDEIIAGLLAPRPAAYWIERLHGAGIAAGVVRDVLQAARSPEVSAHDLVVTVDHPLAGEVDIVGSPLRFGTSRLRPATAPPLLGEHTEEILSNYLGLDALAIAELRRDGVVA